MATHVSIHDVSPAWTDQIERALSYCHAADVKPALLVVPNFHGQWPLGDHPRFCKTLRELQADGHEIYLHGYYHLAGLGKATPGQDGKPSGLKRFFAQRVVSGSEAEMSDVSRSEARQRLGDGEKVLRDAGLTINGFIAPAWSMPDWLLPLLEERRYSFSEDHTHVYDPSRGTKRASLVLNYASRSQRRMWSTIAFCRVAKPARRLFPARIAIHPGDMNHAILRHEVRHLLAWGRGDFVLRGSDLLT